ncbi:MAG: sulfatase [Candidatus Nanosalina sp.]
MNVVLVTVDSLRQDFLEINSGRLVHTPFLDTVARKNVNFTNAYATSPRVRESVPSLISGEYPSASVDEIHRFRVESVAEMLGDEVKTAAFHGNSYFSRAYGYGEGFDTFYDRSLSSSKSLTRLQRIWRWIRGSRDPEADDIIGKAVDWLESRDDEEFFLWTHYSGLEGPFTPPAKFQDYLFGTPVPDDEAKDLYFSALRDEADPDEEDKLLKLYKSGIRYVDSRLDEFFQELNDLNLLDDTLVIITSTNGIALGFEGRWGHPGNLTKEELQVPLIVGGGEASKDEVDVPVSTLDIVPTVLNAFDVSDFSKAGEDLVDVKQQESSYSDRKVFAEVREENPEKVRYGMFGDELLDEAEVHVPTEKVRNGDEKTSELLTHIDESLNTGSSDDSEEKEE